MQFFLSPPNLQWLGHFSPDNHLCSIANTTCPTKDGKKRNGLATEEELRLYADPLVDTHNSFSKIIELVDYTVENPATGRLKDRKVSP